MTTAAVILAAGQGTRMKSALPKVLHQAAGLPLLAYPLRAAAAVGCDPLVAVVGHGAAAVEAQARLHFSSVRIALQAEQKGTAHALGCALPLLASATQVLVLYGDCPLLSASTLQTLLDLVKKEHSLLGVITAVVKDPTGYGRIVRGAGGCVQKNVEHKDATPQERTLCEVNAGIYLGEMHFVAQALARVGAHNAQHEFYLPDLVEMAAAQRRISVLTVDAQEMMGVNTREDLAAVEQVLWARNRRAVMATGCTLRDPSSTFIESGVTVEPDVTLGHGVLLGGNTVLRSGVHVDGPSTVLDCTVEAGAHIKAFSHLEGAHVGSHAVVGPYSRLRPETVLEEGVHVGNFVEVKKSTLHKGAKANHLSYLGDASVGERTNVGAGTITCNYDGHNKHRTTIGRDVFVGSDSVLVAPLSIGDGAYVAAGSVLTQAVPAGQLALGRARQVNKPGYAQKVRAAAQQQAAPNVKKG